MADESRPSPVQAYDIRPVPDPTVLTTQASDRLESMLRNLINTEIGHRGELVDEQLKQVTQRFKDLAERTAEQKKDTKDALDAALAAQKEAVKEQTLSSEKSITKSETATAERIKTVETLLGSATRAIDNTVDDLKERIVAMESGRVGFSEAQASGHQNRQYTQAWVAIAVSMALILITVIGLVASGAIK